MRVALPSVYSSPSIDTVLCGDAATHLPLAAPTSTECQGAGGSGVSVKNDDARVRNSACDQGTTRLPALRTLPRDEKIHGSALTAAQAAGAFDMRRTGPPRWGGLCAPACRQPAMPVRKPYRGRCRLRSHLASDAPSRRRRPSLAAAPATHRCALHARRNASIDSCSASRTACCGVLNVCLASRSGCDRAHIAWACR